MPGENPTTAAPTEPSVEYRDIPGFPGYRVGSDGSVWSRRRTSRRGCTTHGGSVSRLADEWRKMKPITGARYLCVGLQRDQKNHRFRIHGLVLLAFVGPRPEGLQGAHGNGNALDNRLANLSYKTFAENQADRHLHGTLPHGEKSGTAKLTSANAIAIREEREAKGTPTRTLAQRYGVSMFSIRCVLTRKTWKHV